MRMTFGQYIGWLVEEIPDDNYIAWLRDIANVRSRRLRDAIQAEYNKRFGRQGASETTASIAIPDDLTEAAAELLKAGYRACARVHHPDFGGDAEKFRACQAAYKLLSRAISIDAERLVA